MLKFWKRILVFMILIFLITPNIGDVMAKGNKTRYSTTLKSSSGKQYKIKLAGINDKSGIASWNSDKPYEIVWAGANEGDRIYYGNFQFYVNNIKSSQKLRNYTYNRHNRWFTKFLQNTRDNQIYYLSHQQKLVVIVRHQSTICITAN